MAYIPPQESELTVNQYAAVRKISRRTVYTWINTRRDEIGAQRTPSGWRFPMPVFVPDPPYVGQVISFGDGSVGTITEVIPEGNATRVSAIIR